MHQVDTVAQVVAPWLDATDQLACWFSEQAASPNAAGPTARHHETPGLLRALLRTLAGRGEAIPAQALRQVPAQGGNAALRPERIWNNAVRRGPTANDLHLQRGLLLRLGLWRLLMDLRRQALAEAWVESPFVELQHRIARGAARLPPGIAPSLPYAGSPAALVFFNQSLRGALRRLAELHAAARAGFTALAEQAPFEESGLSVQQWSGAWTAAVAGVYLDYLQRHSAGKLDQALHFLWGPGFGAVRFRAPSDLKVLPSRERNIHMDVWTDLVLAQALSHDPLRFQRAAAGDLWHRVRIGMHDLGTRERGAQDGGGVQAFVRGLGVEMIYQAVFIHAAGAALRPALQAEVPVRPTRPPPSPQVIVVSLPEGCPGQATNLELVLRWQQREGARRLCTDDALVGMPPVLTEHQSRAIGDWMARRPPRPDAASELPPSVIDWVAAEPAHRFEDESGAAWHVLGHARLWAAAGDGADWLDLLCVAWDKGRWHSLTVCLQDTLMAGELRSWLLVEPAALAAAGFNPDTLRAALQTPGANFWAVHRAGLGAFVCCALELQGPAKVEP